MQLNSDLERGQTDVLHKLDFPEGVISRFRKGVAQGGHLIVESENAHQLVYRIHVRESLASTYNSFRSWAKWTIWRSPLELPISDTALISIRMHEDNASVYLLPIGPELLLMARLETGPQIASSQTHIKGGELTADKANYWLQVICLSAVKELVFFRRGADVPAIRSRAEENGIQFAKIVCPQILASAGTTAFNTDFGLRVVSTSEYVKFVHSFIQPPNKATIAA